MDLTWASSEIRDRFAIQRVRRSARKIDLVVVLSDSFLIDENQLGHDCAALQSERLIEVENVTNNQAIVRIESDGVSLLVETPQIVITTDQFLKH